jgi:hypothetical protein
MLKNVLGCVAFGLLLAPVAAQAGPLTIVNVSAHAIDCVFNPTCTITPTNFVSTITIPGVGGTAQLHTRTYLGVTGAPGAGLTAYAYRVDLTHATPTTAAAINCVSRMILDFGPDSKLTYGPLVATHAPIPADVFVITTGGPGTIGLSSAVQTGNLITFTFSTPICPGTPTAAALISGKSSFLFGLAAATAPKPSIAKLVFTLGGSATAAARVPIH